jgi:serine/threonine protein kinase
MSDADRFRDVERMWTAALAIDEEGRAAFLEQACAGDDWLRHEVASLLSHDESSAQFLEQPAVYEVAAMDASDRESLVGHEIDGYRITAVLGVGGMGDVYRAVDVTLGREVALKVLSRALMTHTADTQRFEAEARAASALNHPNIVTIYGVGRIGDIAYIAMELVRGRTLRALAEPSAVARTIDYAVQLADALSAAHAAGIIHRDLKPENVMVTDEGLVKVLDFGIAKRIAETDLWSGVIAAEPARYLTEAGTIVGTAEYMSPEQAMGRELDHRSDQFSFGAILYELLTVRRAFERATREETIAAVVNDQPAALGPAASSAIAALQRVVERCLSKDPLARYASTRELAAELRAIRDTSTSVPALTRRRAIALGVAAAVTGIAGAASWRLWTSGPSVSKLAVLPFANPAGDDNIAYLCDGIAESLIRRLSSSDVAQADGAQRRDASEDYGTGRGWAGPGGGCGADGRDHSPCSTSHGDDGTRRREQPRANLG